MHELDHDLLVLAVGQLLVVHLALKGVRQKGWTARVEEVAVSACAVNACGDVVMVARLAS